QIDYNLLPEQQIKQIDYNLLPEQQIKQIDYKIFISKILTTDSTDLNPPADYTNLKLLVTCNYLAE
ncbi:MAG: hypothetical protein AAB019_09140, partial [Planctomycetota bacterium]